MYSSGGVCVGVFWVYLLIVQLSSQNFRCHPVGGAHDGQRLLPRSITAETACFLNLCMSGCDPFRTLSMFQMHYVIYQCNMSELRGHVSTLRSS